MGILGKKKSSADSEVAAKPGVAPRPARGDKPGNADSIDGLLDRLNDLTKAGNAKSVPPLAPKEPAKPTPQRRPATPNRTPSSEGSPPTKPKANRPAGKKPVAKKKEKAAPAPPTSTLKEIEEFIPTEPRSFEEASLNASAVEELVIKYLLARGEDTGQGIADQIKLPFTLINELLSRMKYDQLIHYRGMSSLNDYQIELTDAGRDRAMRAAAKCTYYGAAPVSLKAYCDSVGDQSLQHQSPSREDLDRAFSDLLINKKMFTRLGAAMNSGKGMFLYGFPGNGKTSIAERVTKAFGEFIWVPRAIGIDGEIIRVFDPAQHEEVPLEDSGGLLTIHKIDKRWVRIKRPTIIVGGELTMDNLELGINESTGINEAPVQLKSNCGTLVIDDFGRQRMTTDELLNRWIVPLEKRYDFLNLPSGKKVQVPFDQLVVFSTNLEPSDLVDDAFLRRIPYKIEVENPTEKEYRELFELMCKIMKIEFCEKSLTHLIENHYKPTERPFRMCHPRDLLLQVKNYCKYVKQPIVLTPENFDFAASNYFAVM